MNDDEEWYQAMEEGQQEWWFIQDQDDEWIRKQLGVNDANKQR